MLILGQDGGGAEWATYGSRYHRFSIYGWRREIPYSDAQIRYLLSTLPPSQQGDVRIALNYLDQYNKKRWPQNISSFFVTKEIASSLHSSQIGMMALENHIKITAVPTRENGGKGQIDGGAKKQGGSAAVHATVTVLTVRRQATRNAPNRGRGVGLRPHDALAGVGAVGPTGAVLEGVATSVVGVGVAVVGPVVVDVVAQATVTAGEREREQSQNECTLHVKPP